MNGRLHPLVALAVVHLAKVASKAPMAPKPKRRGGGAPSQQGRRGIAQGYHGASSGARGGVTGLQNLRGNLPHQRPQ